MNEQTPTNGQNPFNLIDQDIANQENVPAVQPRNNATPAENTTATDTVNNQNTTPAAPKKDVFEEIIWKAAKFFAKLMGQPDPETGAPANSTTTTTNTQQPTTNTENQGNTENTTSQKIDFNSVMSGVTGFMDKVGQSKIVGNMTGFLDKVGDKIEEKTGINIDGSNSTATENQSTTQAPAEPVQSVQSETPEVQPTTPNNPDPVQTVRTEAPTSQTDTPVQASEPVQQ